MRILAKRNLLKTVQVIMKMAQRGKVFCGHKIVSSFGLFSHGYMYDFAFPLHTEADGNQVDYRLG